MHHREELYGQNGTTRFRPIPGGATPLPGGATPLEVHELMLDRLDREAVRLRAVDLAADDVVEIERDPVDLAGDLGIAKVLDREGIYADGVPVVGDPAAFRPPPLVAGGQGRSDAEVLEDASGIVAVIVTALLLVAVGAAVGSCVGGAV